MQRNLHPVQESIGPSYPSSFDFCSPNNPLPHVLAISASFASNTNRSHSAVTSMSGTVTSQAATNNPISSIQAPSPMSSATTTPANNSPTSPKLQNAQLLQLPPQSRQLRPPKSPLYVPAVLRPTARTTKPPPPTPPRSFHGSLDSLDSQSKSAGPIRRTSSSESTEIAVSKCAEDVWMKDENLGEVTGSPTRDHWKVLKPYDLFSFPACNRSTMNSLMRPIFLVLRSLAPR